MLRGVGLKQLCVNRVLLLQLFSPADLSGPQQPYQRMGPATAGLPSACALLPAPIHRVPIAIVVGTILANMEMRRYMREKEHLKSKTDSLF